MQTYFETERLILRILPPSAAKQTLAFYKEGREVFERVEAEKSPDFYTLAYQERLLDAEWKLMESSQSLRLFLSPKTDPHLIIGTLSFYHILKLPFSNCKTGYKLLPEWQGLGFASEAMDAALYIVNKFFSVHRVEAYVLPENLPSIRMLKRCGFEEEGIAKSYTLLQNQWKDHLRFSYIF